MDTCLPAGREHLPGEYMHYVYAITTSAKDRVYVGLTGNLEARIKEHNAGRTKSTKHYRPWYLFYHEKIDTRISARAREKQLKSGSGKEFLKNILNKLSL